MVVDQPHLKKCSRKRFDSILCYCLVFFDRNVQSNMGKEIGVDATLTFDP